MLSEGTFRRALRASIQLDDFRDALESATTPDECWQAVRCYYARFGFSQVKLKLAGEGYFETLSPSADPANCWTVIVPLSQLEFAEFSRAGDRELPPIPMTSFVDTVGSALKGKIAFLNAKSSGAIRDPARNGTSRQETFATPIASS